MARRRDSGVFRAPHPAGGRYKRRSGGRCGFVTRVKVSYGAAASKGSLWPRLCENVKSANRAKAFSHSSLTASELMTSGFHLCRNLYPLGDLRSHHNNLDARFHTLSADLGHRLTGPAALHELERSSKQGKILFVFGHFGVIDLNPLPCACHATRLKRDNVVP